MVNILQVDNEESLYQGIENMYTALSEGPDEATANEQTPTEKEPSPTAKKMQVQTNWEEAAADYLTDTSGALHPFNCVPEHIAARLEQAPPHPQKERQTTNAT